MNIKELTVLFITNDQCFSNRFMNIVHSMPRDVKQKKQGDEMEGSMNNRISAEVLLKLGNRTTASLPLDCCHHGAQGHCSGEKEPAKRFVEKPNPSQLLWNGKMLNHTRV